jgi:hypothetical protein
VRAARRVAAVALWAALALTRDAFACPSCFGQPDSPLADSARVGMWVLLGLTFGLQAALAAFFLHLRRRAALARQRERGVDEEWSRLQAARDGREGEVER